MIIRKAKLTDYEEILFLYNGFVGKDRYSKKNNDSFKKVLHSKSNFIYIAEDKGKIIGFITFSIRLVVRYPKPIAELDELYVCLDYRQKGIGKKLMGKVIAKAKQKNCYRFYIESHYKHEAAQKLYENLGFTNYGYHFIKNL